MSACKAVMKPIALAMKPSRNKYACCDRGELMLVHRCGDCSKLSINRIAADDQPMMIEQIFRTSLVMDVITRDDLDHAQIHTLRADDEAMLYSQLYGLYNQR